MTFEEWYEEFGFRAEAVEIQSIKNILQIGWEAALANQWQPIEKAPKDGTLIFMLWPDYHQWGYMFPVVGYWNRLGFWCLKASGQGDPKSNPTRWMTIPDLPKE